MTTPLAVSSRVFVPWAVTAQCDLVGASFPKCQLSGLSPDDS